MEITSEAWRISRRPPYDPLWIMQRRDGRDVALLDRINDSEAIELRDLLLREFPLEQPQPAQSDPDPEKVRRALDFFEPLWAAEPDRVAIAKAARAWLRDRERPAAVEVPSKAYQRGYNDGCASMAPSIAQVIEACGEPWDAVSVVPFLNEWRACAYKVGGGDSQFSAIADTPNAALRKLYDDAIAKLKQQRDEAASKLEKLGVQS